MALDYTRVTEIPGAEMSVQAVRMMRTRYEFARGPAKGARVLELACGPGAGAAFLAAEARTVVGADISRDLVSSARRHHGSLAEFGLVDAHALPYRPGSFDVVVLFEAIYFLADYARFLVEATRVLAPGGLLLLCSANPQRPGFVGSRHAVRYPPLGEVGAALDGLGFRSRCYGAWPAASPGAKQRATTAVWFLLQRLPRIRWPEAVRRRYRRFASGETMRLPADLGDIAVAPEPLVGLGPGEAGRYMVYYIAAQKAV